MNTKPALEFNARFVPPAKIAATFVAPDSFNDVISLNHNIIVGPRGSGKTTLLKMLTLNALQNWCDGAAVSTISNIGFNAAFIPADHVWSAQLQSASDLMEGTSDVAEWGKVAFFIHTVLALLTAIDAAVKLGEKDPPEHLKHLAIKLDKDQQVEFVRHIASGLRIDVPATTLLGLEVALRSYLNLMDPRKGKALGIEELPLSLTTDFFNSLSLIVDVANGLSEDRDRRWALLFDELEIAPEPIRNLLFASMRSFDPRFVVKFALWPYMDELRRLPSANMDQHCGSTKPHSDHDFQVINLTYSHRSEADEFSFKFVEHLFEPLGIDRTQFPNVFGESLFVKGRTRLRAASAEAGEMPPRVFADLAKKDPSFAAYVESKGLDNPQRQLTENEAAALVRKALPVVVMRNFHIQAVSESGAADGKRGSRKRSRKSQALYSGFPSVVQLADGNPRTLLLLMSPLVKELELLRESNAKAKLPVPVQNQAIGCAPNHIGSLLLATPVDLPGRFNKQGLRGLIDVVGKRFAARLLGPNFDPDFVGSFVVDDNIEPRMEAGLGEALNAGALVYVPEPYDTPDSIFSGMKGRRFRLSYALAPRYKLPLTLGRSVMLSNLLAQESQGLLFDERFDASD